MFIFRTKYLRALSLFWSYGNSGNTEGVEVKFTFGRITAAYSLGIYLHNWGYPVGHQWEVGIYLFKWYVGIEFFKEDK